MDRTELALELHKKKFNCAQCVVCSFANVMGYEPIQAFKMSEGFGLGMGGRNATCGVVTAMAMVVGAKISDGELDDPQTKKQTYQMMRAITEEWVAKNGSLICHELKQTDEHKERKTCDELIAMGIEMLDRYLLGINDLSDVKVVKLK